MATATKSSDLGRLAVSWRRSLHAGNRAENTIKLYLSAVELLDAYLAEHRLSRRIESIKRADVEGARP